VSNVAHNPFSHLSMQYNIGESEVTGRNVNHIVFSGELSCSGK